MRTTRIVNETDTSYEALASWENEGGANNHRMMDRPNNDPELARASFKDEELIRLQTHVIALENLVTALLATAPKNVFASVCCLADLVSPEPGNSPYRFDNNASMQMVHIIRRAEFIRINSSSLVQGMSL